MNFRHSGLTLLLISLLLVAGAAGGWYAFQWNARLLKIGNYRVDPLAKINPNRQYDIVVWEHDIFIPGISPEARRMALEAAAAELSNLYPNITVQIDLISATDAGDRLLEALEAGVGPDVMGLTSGGILLDPLRQVPITPYMTDEGLADLVPSVAQAVRKDGHLWAWPRWVTLSVWLGHADRLGAISGLPALNRSTVSAHADEWKRAVGNRPPVAYNALDVDFFTGIMVASTGQSLLSDSGELQWSEDDIKAGAQLVYQLVNEGLIGKDLESIARNRLSAFWTGGASIIAPVGPAILHHALSRLGELTHDPDSDAPLAGKSQLAIMSPPLFTDQLHGITGSVASYAVFLREQHAGDDHTLAAMLVAQHLSRRAGYWEAANLLAVPAYASSLAQWELDSGMMRDNVNALSTLVQRFIAPPVGQRWAQIEAQALQQVVLPSVMRLVEGAVNPEIFATDVARELAAFISARTGKV